MLIREVSESSLSYCSRHNPCTLYNVYKDLISDYIVVFGEVFKNTSTLCRDTTLMFINTSTGGTISPVLIELVLW